MRSILFGTLLGILLPLTGFCQGDITAPEAFGKTIPELGDSEKRDVLIYLLEQGEGSLDEELTRFFKELPADKQLTALNYARFKADLPLLESEEVKVVEAEVIEETKEVEVEAELDPDSAIEEEPEVLWAEAEWDTLLYDFGEVVRGDTVSTTFTVTSAGKVPLELTDAKASCGCTIPEYTKEPMGKGEQGKVTVTFDSSKKKGKFHQGIVVYNNTVNRRSIIYIKGIVIDPPRELPAETEKSEK